MDERVKIDSGSFRDPSGFVYKKNGDIFRQVNMSYKEQYDYLMESGLYGTLIESDLLISHEEFCKNENPCSKKTYKILKAEKIPFISFPFEWSFSQLRDAALLTLRVQKIALDFGMSLKDASAYNIQFIRGKPIFIDTLSFEKYYEGKPWVAYRQFCQHFLAPLTIIKYKDIRLIQLLKSCLDGIPLELTSSLLPLYSIFNLSILFHIHLHAKTQELYATKKVNIKEKNINKNSCYGIIDSLETAISGLKWMPPKTNWYNYYENFNYTDGSFEQKKQCIIKYLGKINPRNVWDIGSNIGLFSRIASDKGIFTVSMDIDPHCIEVNYLKSKEKKETNILPLIMDVTNPSPNIGWNNQERISLVGRGPVDCIMALAIIHHLVISNNVPIRMVAKFFRSMCNSLIIEFVPKSDNQVKKLLSTRKDVFFDYNKDSFEKHFLKYFKIVEFIKIQDSERIIYFMEGR